MKATQSNKLRSFQTLDGVFDKHNEVWKPLSAFARAVGDFTVVIPQITDTVQVHASPIGTAEEKIAARSARQWRA